MSWTRAEVLAEVLGTPRRPRFRLDDTLVLERPDLLQVVTPSLKTGGLNEVAFCRFEPEVAEARIDEALARFHAAGVRFRWAVAPDCGPGDLAERLAARGLQPSEVRVMTLALAGPVDAPSHPVEAIGPEGVEVFTDVMAEGWGAEREPLLRLHQRALESPGVVLFVARVGGAPAGVGASVLSERGLYLMGAVVLPAFRDRGVYRALVNARLAHAQRLGRTLAYSHALAGTSAPRLERMGFTEFLRFASYRGEAPTSRT